MIYNITAHPLLSEASAALGPTELGAQARMAETLLGLLKFKAFDVTTQADSYARATDAVALQVNYQLEAGIEAFITTSLRRGGRTAAFRGKSRMPPVHGAARKIVNAIKPAVITAGR